MGFRLRFSQQNQSSESRVSFFPTRMGKVKPRVHGLNMFKHLRCNPDVAPRLTSGGYEDKVDVITPINILFIGGGEFGSLMNIKLMLLPQPTYCS